MGLEASFKFVETYAKSYLHYILSFFGQHRHEEEAPPATLDDGTLLIFSLMNAVIGAALRGLFVSKISFKDINFPQSVIIEVCYWLTLCILLHMILARRKTPAHFSDSITAILSVLPVSFVIGAYAGFVVYYASLGPFHGDKAPWLAALANAVVQVAVLICFLPRTVRDIRGSSKPRKTVATIAIVALVAGVHTLVLSATSDVLFKPTKEPAAKAPPATLAAVALAFAIGLLAFVGPGGRAFAQDTPAPRSVVEAAATSPAPETVEDGNLFARAWRNGGQAVGAVKGWVVGGWNGLTGHRRLQPAAAASAHPQAGPSANRLPPLPPPRYETQVYLLDGRLEQPELSDEDASKLTDAAQYARLYASPRILIEMAGRPNSPLAPALRQHATLAFEALAAAAVDRTKIVIDFKKGPRLPTGKLLQVSVYF